MRGFLICIFSKTYVNSWLCYGSARLRLLISKSVFELASSRRDRHSFGIARFISFLKGPLFIHKPFTDHTDKTCSYIWPKTWPNLFRFTRGAEWIWWTFDGGMVSKEIGGSVRLPVWHHGPRQWLSKWRAKYSSKRPLKISNLSRKYCSDFLDLKILRSLLS